MDQLPSPETLAVLVVSFLAGGLVKGIIGTGLPTIALALLTATIGIREAMAIILLPSILTNIQQGLFGGHLRSVCKRSWVFFLATFIAIWPGAALLASLDVAKISALLGIILFSYSAVGLFVKKLPNPRRFQALLNPLIGAVNGLLTGLTGSSVVPGVLYLQSLELGRKRLVQTMGLLFLVSTLTLALALQKNQLLSPKLLKLSALAFVPAYLGMLAGIRIRNRISEELFRRLFFIFMLALGVYIVIRAL